MSIANVRWLLLAAVLAPGFARAGAPAEVPVEAGRVFASSDGVMVAIVPLKPAADHKVLVRVTGSGTVFDDKVIPHERSDADGGKIAYSTTYHGRSWFTITVPSSAEARPIPVYLPGRRDVTVKVDERKSAALDVATVYRAYQKQQADGTLQLLAAFNRKQEAAAQEKQLGETLEGFGKQCGYKLPVKIDWGSISDADIRELSIASYCGEPVDAMARLCEESPEAKRTIAAAIKGMSCTLGSEMQLELAGTTLSWTTSRNARNMGEFARKFLEKKL